MILSFAFSVLAGYALPYAEPVLRRALAAALKIEVRFDAAEMRVLTLLLLLAVAALVTLAFGADTSGVAMVLGAGVGVFGLRLVAFLRDPEGTHVPDDALWDGKVRPAGENSPASDQQTPEDEADAAAPSAVNAAMDETAVPPAPETTTKEPER